MTLKLFVLVGLPASGKSIVGERLATEHRAVIVSSDEIRKQWHGDEAIQGNANDIFNHIHEVIIDALNQGNNVVFDATNISYKFRAQLLRKLDSKVQNELERIAVLVATPWSEIIKNNEDRAREVPINVIERMRKNFFAPFWGEGWDDIQIVWNNQMPIYDIIESFNIKDLFYAMDMFDQDNPHHSMTLGAHIRAVRELAFISTESQVVRASAIFHDIGKLWVKAFKNSRGEDTDTAHYYNHENVSAYMALYYLKAEGYSNRFIIDVLTRIQFHMRPYGAKTEKSKMRLLNLVGNHVYADLISLNQADIAAH